LKGCIIVKREISAKADNDKQIKFIEEAIAKKYDCIILQPQNGEAV
jgi:ABC-type sugar transport system substrate-binding protein